MEFIINEAHKLIDDEETYKIMTCASNPYGNSNACDEIVNFIRREKVSFNGSKD